MTLDDFQHILIALEDNRIVTYCSLASYTWFLYDHMLTLGQEIELVWPTPWNLGKVLFFATAYLPLIDGAILTYFHVVPPPISADTCATLYKISGWMIMWGIVIAELVLVFRTWAIWGRNSKLAVGLLLLLCVLAIPTAFFAYGGLVHIEFGPSPSQDLESCWMTKNPNKVLFIDYIMIVIFESIILGLTVYKGIPDFRNSTSNLVVTLYRDGVLYYMYLIAFSLVNIIVLAVAPKPGPSLIFMQRYRDMAAPSTGTDTYLEFRQRRTRSEVSRAIIGVDAWFRDNRTTTQSTNTEMA